MTRSRREFSWPANFRLALAAAPAEVTALAAVERIATVEDTRARLNHLCERAAGGAGQRVDAEVLAEARRRLHALGRGGGEPAADVGVPQLVHGDFQHTNLLFDKHHSVCAIVDWDQACLRDPLFDVLRVLDFSLGLRPGLVAAFVRGYAELLPVTFPQLHHAAVSWGARRDHDVWVLEEAYLRGNRRVRRFLQGDAYRSFDTRWADLTAALS